MKKTVRFGGPFLPLPGVWVLWMTTTRRPLRVGPRVSSAADFQFCFTHVAILLPLFAMF